MDLSVIIVSWNVEKLLKENLKAIYNNARNINFEVFVVDNNSNDETVEMIKQNYPDVKLIENSFNALAEAKDVNTEIKTLLQDLLKEVNEINKKVQEDKKEEAEEMVRDAEILIKEAASAKPRQKWYKVSLGGLKDAAASIGELAVPVSGIVDKLSKYLLSI